MSEIDIQTAAIRDPRIAAHAASVLPAWLWAADGGRVLWMNAAAAAYGDSATSVTDESRQQIAELAGRLDPHGTPRLEQLHGFGAQPGQLRNCSCARLMFDDGLEGVLIVAVESSGKALAHVHRVSFLTDRLTLPAAAFSFGGDLVTWNASAENFIGDKMTLADLGLGDARRKALETGVAETNRDDQTITLYRLGSGNDVSLMALITPADSIVDEDFADEVLVDEDEAQPIEAVTATAVEAARHDTTAAETIAEPTGATPDDDSIIDEAFADEVLVDEDDERSAAAGGRIDARHQPVRFSWVMNADGRFALAADEFSRLVGPQTSAAFGRPWRELTDALHLDPSGAFDKAVAKREAFKGLTVHWPFDGGDTRLPVELSAEPLFDPAGRFAGYRGSGICSDLPRLTALAEQREAEDIAAQAHAAVTTSKIAPDEPFIVPETPQDSATPAPKVFNPEPDTLPKENVVPFRPVQDPRQDSKAELKQESKAEARPEPKSEPQSPGLSPGENHAFDEIARRLTARLDQAAHGLYRDVPDETIDNDEPVAAIDDAAAVAWQTPSAEPPRGGKQDVPLLDRIPTGVLVYSLDRLLYANDAFLKQAGFDSIQALSDAGGLDALMVEPVTSDAGSHTESGTLLTIASRDEAPPAEARLFSIDWNGEPSMALILSGSASPTPAMPHEAAPHAATTAAPPNADSELRTILDTATDGIVLFERSGEITSCNRSAEALFGYDAAAFTAQNLADLFAPESQRIVLDYFESIDGGGAASILDHGREVLARVRGGGIVPLAMTMGRAGSDNSRFFAVFRDLSQLKKNETDLFTARRQAERAKAARADVISRIDHEIRAPLNAIIGFADVMIEERFGPLGNERYAAYLRDIRASGERVLAIVGDMLDLSRIESGKLELAFSGQHLNAIVEQCVAALQPQANRERIIIRTSLAHALPLVLADARTLGQIVTNLVTGSIRLSNPGGQVIVSTALSEKGEAVLRIRDTGAAMSDDDIATATDPYAILSSDTAGANRAGVNLSLTKALVEANRAQLHIRGAQQSGTLMEVIFAPATATVR